MLSLVLLSLISLIPAAESHPASNTIVDARETSTNDKSWQKYVRAPNKIVAPKGVVSGSVTGQVSQPEGLINGGTPTILSRHKSKDEIPSLVVDFGQNIAGYLNLRLKGSTDSTTALPGIRLAFSETLQHLTDRSDFTRSDNAENGDVSSYSLDTDDCTQLIYIRNKTNLSTTARTR